MFTKPTRGHVIGVKRLVLRVLELWCMWCNYINLFMYYMLLSLWNICAELNWSCDFCSQTERWLYVQNNGSEYTGTLAFSRIVSFIKMYLFIQILSAWVDYILKHKNIYALKTVIKHSLFKRVCYVQFSIREHAGYNISCKIIWIGLLEINN